MTNEQARGKMHHLVTVESVEYVLRWKTSDVVCKTHFYEVGEYFSVESRERSEVQFIF